MHKGMASSEEVLDLSGQIARSRPADLQGALGAMLAELPQLRLLDLAANGLGDAGVVALLHAMRRPGCCEQLSFLGLGKNEISDVGGRRIATWLAACASPVQHLELRDNALGDGAAAAFAAVLCENGTLQHLSLLHNSVGRRGAQALADALSRNSALVTLDLRLNQIAEGELHELLGRGPNLADAPARRPNGRGRGRMPVARLFDASPAEREASTLPMGGAAPALGGMRTPHSARSRGRVGSSSDARARTTGAVVPFAREEEGGGRMSEARMHALFDSARAVLVAA